MTDAIQIPQLTDEALLDALLALRQQVAVASAAVRWGREGAEPALDNLARYLELRHHDIRPMQRELMRRGLSSLGRLESRVLETLDATIATLAAGMGRELDIHRPDAAEFFAGEARLLETSERLFGAGRPHRQTRIMVTLPSEAATDPVLVAAYASAGMDIARINCAHDGAEAWRAMAANVAAAGERLGRPIKLLMDIAGPKIRTEAVKHDKGARLEVGSRLRLVARGEPRTDKAVGFSATASLPEIVERLSVGDRVRYDDGKLETVVESAGDGEAVLRVVKAKAGGVKLKAEKGLNLPDTELGLSPMTSKDEADIETVIECADMIGYSFVSRTEDLEILETALAARGGRPELGIVAKIELPEAVRNLPALIERAAGRRPFAVMIARGDLAAEIGFERLAEIQEELLWLCEAASVPVVWATQVLENMVADGIPTRGEMTDAAMSVRAECVMLNKGPALPAAIELLDRLLDRMDDHMSKKTPTLRALKSW